MLNVGDPSRIDAIARGLVRDIWLKPLSSNELELYEIAKRDRVCVSWSRGQKHPRFYRRWCDSSNIPAIEVRQHSRFATIHYDADTTGYPYTCNLTDGDFDRIADLVREHWVAANSRLVGGLHHFTATGLPNAEAVRVARLIWDIAKARTMPAAARPEFVRRAWLGE
jgi:hypothetical protein